MKQRKLRISIEGKQYDVLVEDVADDASAQRGQMRDVQPASQPSSPAPSAPRPAKPAADDGEEARITPLSGIVVAIHVKDGDVVNAGDVVVDIEAMKQTTVISAHRSGTVRDIVIKVGNPVEAGDRMMSIV